MCSGSLLEKPVRSPNDDIVGQALSPAFLAMRHVLPGKRERLPYTSCVSRFVILAMLCVATLTGCATMDTRVGISTNEGPRVHEEGDWR